MHRLAKGRRSGDTFAIDPCIPASWPEYGIAWKILESRYEITVINPERRCRGVASAMLDEAPIDAAAIPLINDGRTHRVRVVLGDRQRTSLEPRQPSVVSERG